MRTGFNRRFVKLYLIEETSLKSLIHILLEIGSGYHDAIKRFHLLKDNVLDRVFHLVHSTISTLLTFSDDGISFIEQQDRC